jgi:hypothetical protein
MARFTSSSIRWLHGSLPRPALLAPDLHTTTAESAEMPHGCAAIGAELVPDGVREVTIGKNTPTRMAPRLE